MIINKTMKPKINPMRSTYKSIHGLQLLTKFFPDNAIGVEIGSYAGESAKIFVESGKIKTLYCIDPWEPNYYSNRQQIAAESQFDKLQSRYNSLIIKCKGTSEYWLPELQRIGVSPDFIYIDGNHKSKFVEHDIKMALKILNGQGIICGHDYGNIKTPDVKKSVKKLLGYIDVGFCDSSWMKIIDKKIY